MKRRFKMTKKKYAVCLLMVCVLALSLLTPAFAAGYPKISGSKDYKSEEIFAPEGVTITFENARLDKKISIPKEYLPADVESVEFDPSILVTYDVTFVFDGTNLKPTIKLKGFTIADPTITAAYMLKIIYNNDKSHVTYKIEEGEDNSKCTVTITGVTLEFYKNISSNPNLPIWQMIGRTDGATLKFTNTFTFKPAPAEK
jgi:hypothetical protein